MRFAKKGDTVAAVTAIEKKEEELKQIRKKPPRKK